MSSYLQSVRDFHFVFGVPAHSVPHIPPADRKALRKKLIEEEYIELMKAIDDDDIVAIADGLCDLHYVLSGTAIEYGIPESACFAEVHRSNMSKADPDGTVRLRPDGKVLKSVHYSPADLQPILQEVRSDVCICGHTH